MEIIVKVDPATGQMGLNCSEDRPWLIVRALRDAADAMERQQLQKEMEAASKIVVASGVPSAVVERLRTGGG